MENVKRTAIIASGHQLQLVGVEKINKQTNTLLEWRINTEVKGVDGVYSGTRIWVG